jgi:hypothetical protein
MSRALLALVALIAVAHPWLFAAAFGAVVLAVAVVVVLLVRKIAREGGRCIPAPRTAPRLA